MCEKSKLFFFVAFKWSRLFSFAYPGANFPKFYHKLATPGQSKQTKFTIGNIFLGWMNGTKIEKQVLVAKVRPLCVNRVKMNKRSSVCVTCVFTQIAPRQPQRYMPACFVYGKQNPKTTFSFIFQRTRNIGHKRKMAANKYVGGCMPG